MDSRPSEIPITGVRYFGKSSRIGGKPVVIADLRGVLTRGIARVFLRVVYGLLGPHSKLPPKTEKFQYFCHYFFGAAFSLTKNEIHSYLQVP